MLTLSFPARRVAELEQENARLLANAAALERESQLCAQLRKAVQPESINNHCSISPSAPLPHSLPNESAANVGLMVCTRAILCIPLNSCVSRHYSAHSRPCFPPPGLPQSTLPFPSHAPLHSPLPLQITYFHGSRRLRLRLLHISLVDLGT